MDGLGNVQQLMLASESVVNSGERATGATCGGVCVGADVGGDSVVKQAAQQRSRGGAAGQVECGQTRSRVNAQTQSRVLTVNHCSCSIGAQTQLLVRLSLT
eukprot:703850-Rhodomonas_salina.1